MLYLPRFPKPGLAAVLSGGLLLLGVSRGPAAPNSPTPAATPSPAAPAVRTSFDEVTARLDKGGSFYLYLSTAEFLDKLSTHVIEWRDLLLSSLPKDQKPADRQPIEQGFAALAKLVKGSGVEQITGFGASSLALEPGLNRNTTFIHHYKGAEKGLLFDTFYGSAPHGLTMLDALPKDTALASYGDFDLAGLLRTVLDTLETSGVPEVKQAVDQGLAQFTAVSAMSLDDVLRSLGGSQGVVLTLDPGKTIEVPLSTDKKQSIPLPRLALIVAMNDDRIFQRLDQTLGMIPNLVKVDEPGLKMRTMAYPATPDFTVRVTVAMWDKFLVIASDDGLLRDLIAAQKSGQGFKTTPEFTRLSAGLPTQGNGFSVVTRRFGETLKQVQSDLMNRDATPPEQRAFMEKLSSLQNVSESYSVSAHVDNGWLNVSKGSQSLNQVLLPLAIVPAAIAAGVALPVYQAVQQKGKATKSEAQAKQIALACALYAGDHKGKFPPTLDALVPTYVEEKTLFVSPFAPDEPLGYKLTPGLTAKSPTDKVLVEDKFASREHQRVVAHVDGSAEVTKVP